MYIDIKKNNRGNFYILKIKTNEYQKSIDGISLFIDNCICEEYREKCKKAIVNIFKSCEHNEKYDTDDEMSYVFGNNEMSELLTYSLIVLSCGGSTLLDFTRLLNEQSELLHKQEKVLNKQNDLLDERGKIIDEIFKVFEPITKELLSEENV